jgi:hypothetical protein
MGDANYLVNTEDIDGEWLANDKEKIYSVQWRRSLEEPLFCVQFV